MPEIPLTDLTRNVYTKKFANMKIKVNVKFSTRTVKKIKVHVGEITWTLIFWNVKNPEI